MLKIIPLSEAAAIDRLRNGLRQGLTRAFAEKTLAERRIWVHQMVADGATDEEIRSATGLRPVRIQAMRRDWLDAVEAARPAKVTPAKVEEMRAAAGRKTRKKRQSKQIREGLQRREVEELALDSSCHKGTIELDSGAYMQEVRRLRIPGPTSIMFKPNPSQPSPMPRGAPASDTKGGGWTSTGGGER